MHGAYVIEHQAPFSWWITLPEIDELLTFTVGGRPSLPVRRANNEIEVALTPTEDGVSRVEFSYMAKGPALDRVSGRLDLRLPRTDLLIHDLSWDLTIPEGYESTALDGNVRLDLPKAVKDDSPASVRRTVCLKKQLVRAEHPYFEVYYRKGHPAACVNP